ncbi:hypothetical protein LEMLEM_LOCUS15812 [Lemmus lemmus]
MLFLVCRRLLSGTVILTLFEAQFEMDAVSHHCNKSRNHLLRRRDSSVELTEYQLESELP